MQRYSILFLLFTLVLSTDLCAQNSGEYQLAGFLMNQQKYDEALPILERLFEEQPDSYAIAIRYTDCLIQLKQYENGVEVMRRFRDDPANGPGAVIRMGELYHLQGDTTRALELWQENIQKHSDQVQIYQNTARAMSERREFSSAIEVYLQGRKRFRNEQIFFSDLANTYLQAGRYEEAVGEWMSLLRAVPNQVGYIQRTLLRYNDPLIYDLSIIEVDEYLNETSVTSESYTTFFEFQIWMLLENELYRRALSTAREYENKTSQVTFALFNLGLDLKQNKEYDLARDAFRYYLDNLNGSWKWRSMEELAGVNMTQAKYLRDNNLDMGSEADSLYMKAAKLLDDLLLETGSYRNMNSVYEKRAEIALDHIFDLDKAETIESELSEQAGEEVPAELYYLRGRIHMAKQEFPEARIALTRANKMEEIGSLAQKTRYFLALTDFYAGDYEFSKIQLKSLGRQNTSYYANDALELRLWIQKGISSDSTGSILDTFSRAYFLTKTGEKEQAGELYYTMLDSQEFAPVHDDILILMPRYNIDSSEYYLDEANQQRYFSRTSSVRENLMWNRARFVLESRDTFDLETIIGYFEELLVEFPNGIYAPGAREILDQLNKERERS